MEPVWAAQRPSIAYTPYNRPLGIVWHREHLSTTHRRCTILIFLWRRIRLRHVSTINMHYSSFSDNRQVAKAIFTLACTKIAVFHDKKCERNRCDDFCMSWSWLSRNVEPIWSHSHAAIHAADKQANQACLLATCPLVLRYLCSSPIPTSQTVLVSVL